MKHNHSPISRREALKLGGMAAGSSVLAAAAPLLFPSRSSAHSGHDPKNAAEKFQMGAHGDLSGPVGDIDLSQFDPSTFLTRFDWGKEGTLESGQNLREYDVVAVDKEIEVAPGVFFPAWTF